MLRPADTSPEAWRIFVEAQRRMSPGEKIRRVFEQSRMVRRLSEARLRQQHPAADEREIFLRRVRLELGPDLFRRVYGDVLPEERPARERA